MKHFSYICLFLLVFSSCSLRAVREAQDVVAEADSLWAAGQMYGRDLGDSATLAQAYEQLGNLSPLRFPLSVFRFPLSASYAHACYHYGRLLREKDNPVAAMECFIRATHSRTRDYHIIGRVYSNMGSISHLAREYSLSHNMFERSAEMFLRNGDTLNYYYALNEMAFELSMQVKKEETLSLIHKIEEFCHNKDVLERTMETKANLYVRTEQYDSVLNIITYLQSVGYNHPTGLVFKAQALWYMHTYDSALYYAKKIINLPQASDQDKYNVLYILIQGDNTLNPDEIKSLSEQRDDIEAKNLVPLHKQYAVAANVLRSDIGKTPIYIYVIIYAVISIVLLIVIVLYSKRIHKNRLHQQKILYTIQQQQQSNTQNKIREIEQISEAIMASASWQTMICWKEYDMLCEYIDKHYFFFAHKLKDKNILSEKEIRLCILVLIGGFSDKQLADILCYGEKSIRGIKRYTAQKLGTTSAKLRSFLIDMIL